MNGERIEELEKQRAKESLACPFSAADDASAVG